MGDSAFLRKIARSVHLGEVRIMRKLTQILLVVVVACTVSAFAQEALWKELYGEFDRLYKQ